MQFTVDMKAKKKSNYISNFQLQEKNVKWVLIIKCVKVRTFHLE